MSYDYLKDIEVAFEAVNKALESVDLAENNGFKLHSSIGSRLYTAKSILSDVLQTAMEDREKPHQQEKKIKSSMNTKINYLYRDANDYQVRNECVIPGMLSDAQKATILGCLDEGVHFIPSLVGMPEEKFDELDDSDVDHQWFELAEESFERTTKKPTVFLSPDELTASFLRCKDRWMSLYLLDVVMPEYTPVWTTRYAVVGIDSSRSAYTVKDYTSKEEYFKDLPLMTSVFEDRKDAFKDAKRVCSLAKVPFIDPEKKASLDSQIHGATARNMEAEHTSDELVCKVKVASGYGSKDEDQRILVVYLDNDPKEYARGNDSFRLDDSERQEAFEKAAKMMGDKGLYKPFILSAEMVKQPASLPSVNKRFADVYER